MPESAQNGVRTGKRARVLQATRVHSFREMALLVQRFSTN